MASNYNYPENSAYSSAVSATNQSHPNSNQASIPFTIRYEPHPHIPEQSLGYYRATTIFREIFPSLNKSCRRKSRKLYLLATFGNAPNIALGPNEATTTGVTSNTQPSVGGSQHQQHQQPANPNELRHFQKILHRAPGRSGSTVDQRSPTPRTVVLSPTYSSSQQPVCGQTANYSYTNPHYSSGTQRQQHQQQTYGLQTAQGGIRETHVTNGLPLAGLDGNGAIDRASVSSSVTSCESSQLGTLSRASNQFRPHMLVNNNPDMNNNGNSISTVNNNVNNIENTNHVGRPALTYMRYTGEIGTPIESRVLTNPPPAYSRSREDKKYLWRVICICSQLLGNLDIFYDTPNYKNWLSDWQKVSELGLTREQAQNEFAKYMRELTMASYDHLKNPTK